MPADSQPLSFDVKYSSTGPLAGPLADSFSKFIRNLGSLAVESLCEAGYHEKKNSHGLSKNFVAELLPQLTETSHRCLFYVSCT